MDCMRCHRPQKVSVQETNNQPKNSLHQTLLHHICHNIEIRNSSNERLSGLGVWLWGNKGDGCVNHHVIESRDYTQVKATHRILTLRAELLLHAAREQKWIPGQDLVRKL